VGKQYRSMIEMTYDLSGQEMGYELEQAIRQKEWRQGFWFGVACATAGAFVAMLAVHTLG
jgi:hypothetical protein